MRTQLFVLLLCLIVSCTSCRRTSKPSHDKSTSTKLEVPPVKVQLSADATDLASIETSITNDRHKNSEQLLDPKADGWHSEAISEQAKKTLEYIIKAKDVRQLPHVASEIRFTPFRPSLERVYSDDLVNVFRPTKEQRPSLVGSQLFQAKLSGFFKSLASDDLRSHLKVVGVKIHDANVDVDVLIEFAATSKQAPYVSRQINTRWNCKWTFDTQGTLSLTDLFVDDYEESVLEVGDQVPWFSDETMAVVGNHPSLWKQLSYGHHHWLQRIERIQRFDTSVRNGLAVGDANGDGLDDVYLCQPPGLPNRLFIHQADGTALEQSQRWNVDWMDQTSSALFCDLDNDGDQDLVLGMHIGVVIMENNGEGSFETRARLETDYDVQSLSAADFDNDGRLDIYVCVYRTHEQTSGSFLYRDAIGGGTNRLFRNCTRDGGELSFADVTQSVGLDDGADRYSLAASWEDFDNDGDQDLYVANDFGRNHFYENRNGQFVDIAKSAGVLDIGSGMSVSWADYNRDGLPDLYVGNMFSSAGRRITTQSQFRSTEANEIRDIYRRLAKGNTLYLNQGNRTFKETSSEAGVEMGRWAWSSVFADINNDGWEDLLVANGYMTTSDTGDL